ncbi:MAG: zinc/iron permease [archaeon GW2011_AR10]|nr:MAG: zinc/iron permease [archaeon GW2011_AR10]
MFCLNETIYIFGSVLFVSVLSLVGVLAIGVNEEKLKKALLLLVGFSAGALFGDVFFHLLPEAVKSEGFSLEMSVSILAGIILFFALEKLIRWHHHHNVDAKKDVHTFGYMNLVGDGLHNFIDGALIAGAYLASIPVGIATTIAVILHEIPQEIGDFGVLLHSGFSKKKALAFNFLSALTALLGAAAALYFSSSIENFELLIVSFTVGGFIYIAGSDLIPELHHEDDTGKSVLQIIVFLAGILVMALLLFLE